MAPLLWPELARGPEHARLRIALGVTVVVTLVTNALYMASVLLVDRPSSGYLTLWDGWIYNVAMLAPAGLSALRAHRDRRNSLAWWLVTAGIVCNTVANLQFTYHDQNLSPVPFPAWSDAPYLASYVAFAAALFLLTHQQDHVVSRAVRLDGLVVGLSAGAVSVALWFHSVLSQTGTVAAVLVGLAYPLFDLVFIVILASGLAPIRYRPSWSTAVFGGGVLAFAIGDIVYLNEVAADTYHLGTLLEWSWGLGIMAFGFAAWLPDHRRRPVGPMRSQVQAVIPLAAALTALAVVAAGVVVDVAPLASWLAIGAIGAALGRVGLSVRELLRANEAYSQARTDELTGLPNRRGFATDLDARLADPDRQMLSVLMIDLDGFKEVNDSLGHHAGDQLLSIVGQRFAAAASLAGTVARLGGDEFAVIVAGHPRLGEMVTESLLGALVEPVSIEGITIRIGASIGIARAPEHGSTRQQLLRAADVAMYDAKAHHRGSSVYDVENDPHSRDRLALIEDLRTAIDDRSFEMHYQPTISVADGRVVGMEALIRWNHPVRGMLPPDQFIPLAERVGLIPAITRAVLDLSIAHLADTLRAGHELGLSVNISAMDLVDDDLPRYVRSTLDAHEVPPRLLTLEITETALSSDAVRAERTLNALRADGVRISIDDFGVGYSSMSQLLKLPLDELKIDRSFITNLADDLRAQAILAATVELGRTLGLAVVAEGIETSSALTTVADHGVETAQGFFFSRALPPAAFERFVSEVAGVASGR